MATATPDRLQLRTAMEAGDLDGALDAFAPDAIVRSPFTDRLAFRGRQQIRAILEVVLESFADLRYTAEVRSGDAALLVSRARVAGEELEIADHIRLDADGKISEFTVFFRPLPASAAAMRVIAGGLGRRRSPLRGRLISALTAPLGALTRAGDPIGVRLVRPDR